jgi:hypothetical protein
MRLVQLRSTEQGDPFVIDLHPQLTVVRGLDPARRKQFLRAVESVVNGRPADLDGVVEAHGVLLDIGPEALGPVLGLGGDGAAIDPVVRPGDLPGPGQDETLAASRRRNAERTLDELRERLEASEASAAEARRRCDAAMRRLAADASGPDGAEAGRSAVEVATRREAVRAAQVATDEARRRLEALVVDPTVGDRLSAGRARRAAATRGLAAAMNELSSVSRDLDGNAERALDEAHASVVELQAGQDAGPNAGSGSEQLSQVRQALPALALRLVRHHSAVGRIAQLEVSVAGLQSEEQAAIELLARIRTAHTCTQAELRGRLRAATAELVVAKEALLGVADGSGDAVALPDSDRVQMERRLLVARIDLGGALAASELLRAECDAQGRRIGGEAEPASTARSRRTQVAAEEAALHNELEWYLLSRLVHQRSIGVAGSAPLVLDDAFARLPPGTGPHLLEWLERLAPTVQVVVLSDDPHLAAWLDGLPGTRGAMVDGAEEMT